jgi:predicted permease
VPVVNFAAVGMLARHGTSRVLPAILRNPLVLSCIAGLLWSALHRPLPDVADRVLGSLGGASLALGLLTVGAALKVEGGLPMRAVAYWTAVKLAAVPAFALAVGRMLELPPTLLQVALIMAAVPAAPSAYVLATQMSASARPVALLVTTGTLFAAITLPLWLVVAS